MLFIGKRRFNELLLKLYKAWSVIIKSLFCSTNFLFIFIIESLKIIFSPDNIEYRIIDNTKVEIIITEDSGIIQLGYKGLKTNYPVKACHLMADFDDFLLPIAIATKSKGLQQFLKIISPITFAPLGINVGTTKDSKYYDTFEKT